MQQCGRFHDLSTFDGNRKSCREQLSKHNERRRRRAQVEQHKSKQAEQVCFLWGLVKQGSVCLVKQVSVCVCVCAHACVRACV